MATKQQVEGTIMRGADGSLFFLRKEVLEASKVTEKDMQRFLSDVVDKKANGSYSLNGTDLRESVTVRGSFEVGGQQQDPPRFSASSTVMCAGTMGLADIDII